MAAPQFMIRTVTSFNTLDKFIPDFQSLDLSPVLGSPGTIVIKYPANGRNFNLLQEDTELAITIDGVEAGGLRCIIEQIEGDDLSEAGQGQVWTFTCRTMLGIFDRAIVYPKNWPSSNPPNHSWTNANPGEVLWTLIDEATERGALANIQITFNQFHDSSGATWTRLIESISFDAGTKISEVIQNLLDNDYIDVKMDKRTLFVFNPSQVGIDRSTGSNPLRFQGGRDIKESPRKISTRELATTLLVAGLNNAYVETTSDSPTMSMWGRREAYWSANNTSVKPVLDFFGGVKLSTLNRPLVEITHGLVFDDENVNPRPIRDFDIGDWGLSDVGKGWEKYRIKQWVMSVDNNGEVSGSVTLNDLIAEQIEKLNDRLGRIEDGLSETGASVEKDDGKPPAQVTGVTLNTDYYLDNNVSRAFITVNWAAVTTNDDGTDANDISYYLIRWRYVGSSDWQPATRVESDSLSSYFAGIFTNRQVEVQVRAADKYNHTGAWSVSAITTTARDTVAPNKPSAPVVTSSVGTLRVTWNGKDYQGNSMPADFVGVEVHIGTDGVFTPSSSTLKSYMASASAVTITGLAYGTDWFARLVAVDTSGNKSTASDQTSTSHAVLTQVVSTEIGTGQVGLKNTAFSDVGNLIDDGNLEIASVRVARQNLFGSYHMAFDNSTSSVGSWSLRSDSFAGGTLEYFTLQDQLPVKPGERIFGALDMRATADTVGTVNLDIAWYDASGTQIDASGNPISSFYTLAGIANTTKDNTWHRRVTGTSKVAPVNVATMQLLFYTTGRTAGTVWVDAIEVRRQIDTLLIQDAAITTAQIADLAVNDAKIADASIGKLTAGNLTADMTVAARIKTANTGARVELNSTGLKIYNSGGTQTGSFNSADGSIDITGTLRSGTTGTRIEVNPSGLPTIRLYSGAGTEFGFINGFTISGTDVGVGINSSPFSGNSTQLSSRLVAFAGSANLELVRADNQQVSGGYLNATPTALNGGYSISGANNAYFSVSNLNFYATGTGTGNDGYVNLGDDYAKIGVRESLSSENTWYFDPTGTRHYGKWDNNVSAASNTQGLHMGQVNVTSGFSGTSVVYGPTMASAMRPVATLQNAAFDNTTGTSTTSPYWGITTGMGSNTGFSIGWDKAVAVGFCWWSFRT